MSRPRWSIVIPAWNSHATLEACLASIATRPAADFETIVVDSSPDERGARIVTARPAVRLVRSERRLWMHAARNAGARQARGEILVFTDPDCTVAPDWLDELGRSFAAGHRAVIGAFACGAGSALGRAAHLSKFWLWLPGGSDRPAVGSPSGNFAVERTAFEAAGGFSEEYISADTAMGDRLRRLGIPVHFNPRAIVTHHHAVTWDGFRRERRERGRDYARMRIADPEWSRARSVALAAGVPILTLTHVARVLRRGTAAGFGGWIPAALPGVVAGEFAWMAGQGEAAFNHLLGRRTRPYWEGA